MSCSRFQARGDLDTAAPHCALCFVTVTPGRLARARGIPDLARHSATRRDLPGLNTATCVSGSTPARSAREDTPREIGCAVAKPISLADRTIGSASQHSGGMGGLPDGSLRSRLAAVTRHWRATPGRASPAWIRKGCVTRAACGAPLGVMSKRSLKGKPSARCRGRALPPIDGFRFALRILHTCTCAISDRLFDITAVNHQEYSQYAKRNGPQSPR